MNPPPDLFDGARLVQWSAIDDRHQPTGHTRHIVAGVVQRPAAGLAICQYQAETAYYLFRCDPEWKVETDTCHESVEDAVEQAEFEYEGVSSTWIVV